MLKKIGIFFLSVVLLIVLALASVSIFLSTDKGQQWVKTKMLGLLTETLHAKVDVSRIGLDIMQGTVELNGIEIDDRSGMRMLQVDTLEVRIDPLKLYNKEVSLSRAWLHGATIVLYKEREDTAANYQFFVDCLKPKKKNENKEKWKFSAPVGNIEVDRTSFRWDLRSKPRKGGDTLDVNHLNITDFAFSLEGELDEKGTVEAFLRNFNVTEQHSGAHVFIRQLHFRSLRKRNVNMQVKGLYARYQDKIVRCGTLDALQQNAFFAVDKPLLLYADSLMYHNDNGKPRKNTGKPNRGAFDAGHLDAVLGLDATVNGLKDSMVSAKVKVLYAHDKGSGLNIKNAEFGLEAGKEKISVSDLAITLEHSVINAKKINVKYGYSSDELTPTSKKAIKMTFEDFPLYSHVLLSDIAQPFAPHLKNFSTPLNLHTTAGGTLDKVVFKGINISTDDKRLALTAEGDLCDMMKKGMVNLHFNVISMRARSGIKEQIVNHFSKQVRLKMLRQMAAIGDISYKGKVGIFGKDVSVAGTMFCKYANVDFSFLINGNTKMMTGEAKTDSINLGEIMNVKKLYLGRSKARFGIDLRKKQLRKSLRQRQGRLPSGWVEATIEAAKYKFLKVTKITTTIKSDGAVASGSVSAKQKLIDVDATFDYTQTDNEQGLRIHPKLRLHKKDNNNKKEK